MNINEENKDLIENLVPWGLLDEETQSRLLGWKHGWEVWCKHAKHNGDYNWKWLTTNIGCGHFEKAIYYKVYRARPAPKRRECYVHILPNDVRIYNSKTSSQDGAREIDFLSRLKISVDPDGSNAILEVLAGNK